MASHYLIKFDPTTGQRTMTYPCTSSMTEEQKQNYINDGFELVPEEDFQLLIGNVDGRVYIKNVNGEGYIPKPPFVLPLEEEKERKLNELKNARDIEEVEPILFNGDLYDYDEKARDRINAAIIALDQMGEGASISWTLADNANTDVTSTILRGVIGAVAIRSNALHVKYRMLKEQVLATETNEAVKAITWENEE